MSDLTLDPQTHDLVLSGGDLTLITVDGAIRQDLKQRLLLFLGEWFLATTDGVPYYQSIFVKNPNLALVEVTIKSVILSCPGVLELNSFDFNYDNAGRALSITCNARTSDGTIEFTATIGGTG